MSVMATFAPATAQSMCSQALHLLPAMSARVRPAQKGTQAKACGHPDGAVIHAETKCLDRQNIQSYAADSLAKEAY